MKELFVLGYAPGSHDAAGLIFERAGRDGTPLLKELFPSGMSPAEVAVAMDRFYLENIRAVINAAIKIIAQRAAGADEAEVEKVIANARSEAAR